MSNMKPETVAERLAEVVNKRKVIESKISDKRAAFSDEIEHANEIVSTIAAKMNRATRDLDAKLSELQDDEKEYRSKLLSVDLMDATFNTFYGSVSIQRNPTPVVSRFALVPVEFRKDPDQCINTALIKKSFKDGNKVPGVNMIDFPKVVVR